MRKKFILHRGLAATAAVLLLAGVAAAQRPRQRKASALRALGVVEWPARGRPRLVPVCILVDGQYYDAGIYLADPVPMALDSGNVYEVEKSGDPQGFFTVSQAQQVEDAWYGLGSFQPLQETKVAEKAPSEVRLGAGTPSDASDEPPKLKRGSSSGTEQQPAPAAKPSEPSGDQPPVLKKRTEGTQAGAPAATQAPSAPEPAAAQPSSTSSNDSDPNRPVLRRGKPAARVTEESIEPPKSAITASSRAGAERPEIENPAQLMRVLPAISDGKGGESRNYAFDWTPQEQKRITRGMQDLARTSLQEYLKGRGDTAGALQDVQVHAFDLDLTNEPVFVLTATAPTAPPPAIAPRARRTQAAKADEAPARRVTYFVTVVARADLEGNLRRIYRRVTDSGRLDAYSRLELIDAVDVDGDGRGELLFRSINDQSRAFVVFRATVDNLTRLYNSRELER